MGKTPQKSAPTRTQSNSLKHLGFKVYFSSTQGKTALSWLKELQKVNIAIYIGYEVLNDWFIRRIALSNLVNRLVFRWWVGSDVLRVINDDQYAQQAKIFNQFTDANFVVSPPLHLISELQTMGIQGKVMPPFPPEAVCNPEEWSPIIARRVLVHLPKERQVSYGAKILDEVIPQNPDIKFILLENHGSRYQHLNNFEEFARSFHNICMQSKPKRLIRLLTAAHIGVSLLFNKLNGLQMENGP